MPRPPKSAAAHKAQGTLRKHRHEDRGDSAPAAGKPQMPAWVRTDKEAARLWRRILKTTNPDAIGEIDSEKLATLCRWWSHWRRADEELQQAWDEDKMFSPRVEKCLRGARQTWEQFLRLSSEFGMSPMDRAKIKGTPMSADAKKPKNPLIARLTG